MGTTMKLVHKTSFIAFLVILLFATPAVAQQMTSYSLLTEASQLTKKDISAVRDRADEGDAHAQVVLGTAYAYGLGVRQNYSTATKWFLRAAQAGDPLGETLLGQMYQREAGLHQKQADAFSWFRRAADQGSAEAQFELAKAYAHGWGVPVDENQAEVLYRMAADSGFAPAKCILESRNPAYPRPRAGGIVAPHPVSTPDPEYSDPARKAKLSGTVELWVGVGDDGLVQKICVSQPLGLGLEDKAVETVQQWKFNPATRNGQPIAVGLAVTTRFNLY